MYSMGRENEVGMTLIISLRNSIELESTKRSRAVRQFKLYKLKTKTIYNCFT